MLVAEKQRKSYDIHQELQTGLPKGEPRKYPRAMPRERPRTKVKPRLKGKVFPIFVLMIMFSLSCLAITRYVIINQNHQEIMGLKDTLQKEENRQQNLRVDLAAQGNLDRIEKVAKEDLGMDYPTKDQVQAVELPGEDLNIAIEIENIQPLRQTIVEYIVNMFN